MRNLERPSTVIVVVAMLALAGLVGLAIPLASGGKTGSEQVAWTSPTPVPPTAPALTATAMETVVTAPTPMPTFTPSVAHTSKPPKATQPVELIQSPAPTAQIEATQLPSPAATQIAPSATVVPARSSGKAFNATVAVDLLNLREGPGQGFGVIRLARAGEVFTVTARSNDGGWLQVCCVNQAPAWLATGMVTRTGTIEGLPIAP